MSNVEVTIDALNKKGFKAVCMKDAESAVSHVLGLLGEKDVLGIGGSLTLDEIGLLDALLEKDYTIYSSSAAKKIGMDPNEARKLAMDADVYLSSTNGVTMEGDLINIDAIGNRVAGMFYGPKKVIIVTGKNKITANPHTAVLRIKNDVSPRNAKRLGLDTPCTVTGKCEECRSPQRICNVTTRIHCPPWGKEIHIVIIDEDFGF